MRVCIVPLGAIDSDLMQRLVRYYDDEHSLPIQILTPQAVPGSLASNNERQIDAEELIGYMNAGFPDEAADSTATLIGLTPLDIYSRDSSFHFLFASKGAAADPKAVISTFRMDPRTFGEEPDDALLFDRARKMIDRYIGFLYLGLPMNDDPRSPLTASIMGLSDLDRISKELPATR